MNDFVINFMLNEMKIATYWSLIIDSLPDVSHVDQLTFVIRYVLEDGSPIGRFGVRFYSYV